MQLQYQVHSYSFLKNYKKLLSVEVIRCYIIVMLPKLAVKTSEPIVYKFVPKSIWNNFVNKNEPVFRGYGDDLKKGFVHMSTHEQLYHSFTNRHYLYEKIFFKLLAVDLNVAENVIWEEAKDGLIYPHAYSGLVYHDIIWFIDMDDYLFGVDGM